MTSVISSGPEVLTFDHLRALAAVEGVCLSAAFHADPAQAHAQLNSHLNLMRQAVEKHFLGGLKDSERKLREFLEPVREVLSSEKTWDRGIVFYRSAEFFQHFLLDRLSTDFITVGDRFELRPLLSVMGRDQCFYVLALSQKHT